MSCRIIDIIHTNIYKIQIKSVTLGKINLIHPGYLPLMDGAIFKHDLGRGAGPRWLVGGGGIEAKIGRKGANIARFWQF